MTNAVRAASLGILGSIAAAIITTLGTIWVNESNLKTAQEQVKTLDNQVAALKEQTSSLRLAVLPVGTIVTSVLDPVQFAKETGDSPDFNIAKSKWTLADGKMVSGTAYASLSANSPVPDLRGLFLRGKNNKRSDGHENPEGDLNLGQFQDDQFQEHIHEFNVGGQGGSESFYAYTANKNLGTPRARTNFVITGKVGSETRPRNATVNYYIRIN